jgi:hypothetical protein
MANQTDFIDDEISEHSIRENVFYMTITASQMITDRKIPDVPRPILAAEVILLAEEFEREYGSEVVDGDTVKAIDKFAEEWLLKKFGN